MTMDTKTLWILAAITAPVTAAALLMPGPQTRVTPPKSIGRLIPGLAKKLPDVDSIFINSGDDKITLNRATAKGKDASGWTLANRAGYPVPEATIKPVLDALETLHGVEPKTSQPALYGRLDLGAPSSGPDSSTLIEFRDKGGKALAGIILGKHKPPAAGSTLERIYARQPDKKLTWLAAPVVTLPDEVNGWINSTIVDLDADKIKTITISQANAGADVKPLVVTRAKAGEKPTVPDLPAGAKMKTDTSASDIPNAFHDLELTDVEKAGSMPQKPYAVAHAETVDGLAVDLALAKDKGQTWLTVAAKGTGKAAKEADAINARTSGWAYQVAEDKAASLSTKLADLLVPPPAPPKPAAPAKPAPHSAAPAQAAQPAKPPAAAVPSAEEDNSSQGNETPK
jgi:hypothetical protein